MSCIVEPNEILLQQAVSPASTTNLRREFKSVVSRQLVDSILARLEAQIELHNRDPRPLHGVNSTFTFYGRGVKFRNGSLSTKIKLRARFYLVRSAGGEIKRSPMFRDCLFLELKIKNPNPNEYGVVNKYRFVIQDADLAHLYELDPLSSRFGTELETLKHRVKTHRLNAENSETIDTIFGVITMLSQRDPEFIRPFLATSYERTARFCEDQSYQLPDSRIVEGIEYEITFDNNIKGYKPSAHFWRDFSFDDYFRLLANKDMVSRYPRGYYGVEVKVPAIISSLPLEQRSPRHLLLHEELIAVIMNKASVCSGYQTDKGKLSFVKEKLKDSYAELMKDVLSI